LQRELTTKEENSMNLLEKSMSVGSGRPRIIRHVPRRGDRRVLIIVQDLPVPYDRRTWLEATTLRNASYTVSVICPKAEGFTKSFERIEDIDVYRYNLPFEAIGVLGYLAEFIWCFIRSALLSLRVQLIGRGFDAIHACNPPETYWLLALAWRLAGKRFLFDHHDLSPEMYEAKYRKQGGLLYRALLWLEKMSFATAHTTIATNESYKEVACGRGGVPAENVFIVRSGPDPTRFRIVDSDLSLKQGRRFLCSYLGKMCEQDGVDYLVRAIKILCVDRGRRDILFVLMGRGPAQPDEVRYAEKLGVSKYCHFTGYVSDEEISRYLSTTDVAIDPDPKTTWSDKSTMNKIMDYMFFGCPIVAFDLRENRFSAQKASIYVTPNSEDEMAAKIGTLLADENRRRLMGEHGKNRVSALLWENSVPHLLSAYENLFAAKPRRLKQTFATRL
jgi:glycosyltransferase involved in cell wall biosynthesis